MLNRNQLLCTLILILCLFVPAYTDNATIAVTNATSVNNTAANATNPFLPPLPPQVLTYMASRQMRYHHFLWHNIRNNWNKLSVAAQEKITELGWGCPRPARSFDANGNPIQLLYNGAGEDFFYMHRYMILKFDTVAEVYNEHERVVAWATVPTPNNTNYPVPPNYIIPWGTSYNGTKTDSFFWDAMYVDEQNYTNLTYLAGMSLSEFGARMEITLHSWMHLRWSANSTYGFRPQISGMIPDIDVKWDDPQYNWMGDFYASQVNPYFWKLHGWIDNRIADWQTANNVTDLIWNGTWIGGPVSNLSSIIGQARRLEGNDNDLDMDMDEMDDTMPKVLAILMNEVPESTFADVVTLEDAVPKN